MMGSKVKSARSLWHLVNRQESLWGFLAIPLLSCFLSTTPLYANVVGNNGANFIPAVNKHDYATVYSSRTLGAGILNLGLFLDTAGNTLPYFENKHETSAMSERSGMNDVLMTTYGSLTYGVLDNLDVSLAMPVVLYQHIDNKQDLHGEYGNSGITDVRLAAKAAFLRSGPLGLSSMLNINLNTTKDTPYEADGNSMSVSLELIGDYDFGLFDVAMNLGYKLRNVKSSKDPTDPVSPFNNQLLASSAVGYKLPVWSAKVIGEIYSSAPLERERDISLRHTTRAEALVGMKVDYSDALTYHYGITSELRHSTASADWRLYAGFHYTLGTTRPRSRLVEEAVTPLAEPTLEPTIDEAKPDEILVVRDVLFKFDSDQIDDLASNEALQSLAANLRKGGDFRHIVIEGHTCSMGTDRYNLKLSKQRANKIKNILSQRFKFSSKKMTARGWGERRPVASNKNEEGRRLNRRVEFKIYR